MPQYKQPETLENLSLATTVKWLCQVGKSFMFKVTDFKHNRSDAALASENLKKRLEIVHKIFQYNIPCYLYDQLSVEIYAHVPKIVEGIKQGLRSTTAMSVYLSQVNVAVALSEVLISPFLRRLNFEEMPKMMRLMFYSNLQNLKGLVYLNLSSLSGGWKTCEMEPVVLNGIGSMKNLHTLVLNYDCTDNILKLLGTACPRLQTLDISSSMSINNHSVQHLLELHYLRNLQLNRTSITIEGYTRLLIGLPILEDIGRNDEIGRCLEYVDLTFKEFPIDERPKLKLKTFVSHYVIIKHLQLLAEWCPEITTVSIFHNPLLNDLMLLIGINKLKVLKLLSCDFFGDQVRDVLKVKGCNLTHLHFEHVDEIDMNALMYVSQFCPDLKIFTIYNCELVDSTSLSMKSLELPPFMNLERLTIAAFCSQKHMEFLLTNCFKVKFIQIGTMAPISDGLFDRILARNPMEYLEELLVVHSNFLSIKAAYKLVDVCQNLFILGDLESWTLINDAELENFRSFVSSRNFNLNTRPLRAI